VGGSVIQDHESPKKSLRLSLPGSYQNLITYWSQIQRISGSWPMRGSHSAKSKMIAVVDDDDERKLYKIENYQDSSSQISQVELFFSQFFGFFKKSFSQSYQESTGVEG
jgi:hypothetical protein